MTREEVMSALTEIGTCEDAAQRRQLITNVTEAVTGVFDSNDTLTSANTKHEADIKKLQEYNMQLFLKVGGQQPKPQQQTPEPQKDTLTYENLFDEKGEIK